MGYDEDRVSVGMNASVKCLPRESLIKNTKPRRYLQSDYCWNGLSFIAKKDKCYKEFRKGNISMSVSKSQEENFVSTPKPIFLNFILHKYTINTKYLVMKAKKSSFFVSKTNVFMHCFIIITWVQLQFFMHFLLSFILYCNIIIRRFIVILIMIFW